MKRSKPKLNYKILGEGQPVLILHGLFGMLDNWLSFAKKLAESGYMAILIDQRDHGRSEHTTDFNYKLLAEDLYHFMEEHWIHSAHLIGHSMGGKTALQFVSDHTTEIKKLVVVDIGIKSYTGGHEKVFEALLSIDLSTTSDREAVENIISHYISDIGTIQFLMKNLTRHKDGHFEWKMNLPLLYANYKNILSSVTPDHVCHTETLFIKGQLSDYILDEDIEEIKTYFPNASFKEIASAGHWVHADKPVELFETIIDFIKD